MQSCKLRGELGAVTIMVALWLPLLAVLMTFGVDVPHWFDYKRNLQTRADAAALAGGAAYGGACFAAGGATSTALASIGHTAQYYSGADPNLSDLAYPNLAGTYYNPPNLSKGSLSDFHFVLNGTQYWHPGTTAQADSFTMTPSGTLCDSTDETGWRGALLDVKVTQANLGLFFPLPFKQVPAITAHARVSIQNLQVSKGVRPVAVRDAGVTPCVWAYFIDDNTGNSITNSSGQPVVAKLTNTGGTPSTWTSQSNPVTVPIPVTHHVSVQMFLNDCNSSSPNGDLYIGSGAGGGLLFINNWGNPTAPVTNQAPRLASGGVTLAGAVSTTCDPYFSTNSAGCAVGVEANVVFAPGVVVPSDVKVTAVMDPGSSGSQNLPLS
jgi:hypothetical protein